MITYNMNNQLEFNDIKKCKQVLEEFLLGEEYLPIDPKLSNAKIENIIANYLLQKGYDNWLSFDDISNYIIDNKSVASKALEEFSEQNKIFNGKSGVFKIIEKPNTNNNYFEAKAMTDTEIYFASSLNHIPKSNLASAFSKN